MPTLAPALEERLTRFAEALVDQRQACIAVPPHRAAAGYWFGGGNMIEAPDGALYLVGRYRNAGDSRTGLAAGERGLELAIFVSRDHGMSFKKVLALQKADLTVGNLEVYSIEGAALRWTDAGVELFVSTEKGGVGYPAGFEDYLKPGTGVWSIERLHATTLDRLRTATPETALASRDPLCIHVKDPFLHDLPDGDLMLLFCSHPYCWTSSSTGYAVRRAAARKLESPRFDVVPRGVTWDVAMTRGTCVLDIPRVGAFRESHVSLLFYDGGECVRNHDEHAAAVTRPRGYSCEELGGVAYVTDGDFAGSQRLSRYKPMFTSPHGTGCSRYVDVVECDEGWYATWQQSQPDGSQPLVINFVPRDEGSEILGE